MSWAEVKKAINSDLSTPLNSQLTSKANELANKFGLEYVETALVANSPTISRSYDAIVVPLNFSTACTVYEGTSSSDSPIVFLCNGGNGGATPFFKMKKNTNYYVSVSSSFRFAFYKLGGGI